MLPILLCLFQTLAWHSSQEFWNRIPKNSLVELDDWGLRKTSWFVQWRYQWWLSASCSPDWLHFSWAFSLMVRCCRYCWQWDLAVTTIFVQQSGQGETFWATWSSKEQIESASKCWQAGGFAWLLQVTNYPTQGSRCNFFFFFISLSCSPFHPYQPTFLIIFHN
jgi:hypothetical protein